MLCLPDQDALCCPLLLSFAVFNLVDLPVSYPMVSAEPPTAMKSTILYRDLDEGMHARLMSGSLCKSTRTDLAWLHSQGWEAAIQRHLRYGGQVLGLCGGFQMLGRVVHDPEALEGPAGSTPGLGLLDLETRMVAGK